MSIFKVKSYQTGEIIKVDKIDVRLHLRSSGEAFTKSELKHICEQYGSNAVKNIEETPVNPPETISLSSGDIEDKVIEGEVPKKRGRKKAS